MGRYRNHHLSEDRATTEGRLAHADVVLRGVCGSRAYGLHRPDSDFDRVAVAVAPPQAFLGVYDPDLSSWHKAVEGGDDITVHELRKFCNLVLACNPTVTELLWLDEDGYDVVEPVGRWLLEHRGELSCARGVKNAYLGYATSQLKQVHGNVRGDEVSRLYTPRGVLRVARNRVMSALLDEEAARKRGYLNIPKERPEDRRRKMGRHAYRLVHQGVSFYRTGQLELKIDREACFAFGDAFADGREDGAKLMGWATAQFMLPTPLPKKPPVALVDEWLTGVRTDQILASCGVWRG